MKKRYSPLRWAGGKSKMIPFVNNVINQIENKNITFVQPFAGGAGVSLFMLGNSKVNKIIINDFDYGVYSFWHSVFFDNDNLIKIIEQTDVTMQQWLKRRQSLKSIQDLDTLQSGYTTFFLNRTNRSGILSAGAIGGLSQSGKWKINERFNKKTLINQIKNLKQYSHRVQIYNKTYNELYKCISNENLFSFVDPPYYQKGKSLYRKFFIHNDHLQLSQMMKNLNHQWILTYDLNDNIKKMYQWSNSMQFNIKYSVTKAFQASQLLIYSDGLKTILEKDKNNVELEEIQNTSNNN